VDRDYNRVRGVWLFHLLSYSISSFFRNADQIRDNLLDFLVFKLISYFAGAENAKNVFFMLTVGGFYQKFSDLLSFCLLLISLRRGLTFELCSVKEVVFQVGP